MDRNEHWKEQLGFISGTILVWGTLLLSLWPSVAGFQTGINAHPWSVVLPGEAPKPGWDGYQFLTAPLSLGVSALFFSVIHIFSRGLWLGIPQGTSDNSLTVSMSHFLERLADKSYLAVFAQWLFGAVFLFFGFMLILETTIELLVAPKFVVSSLWPRTIGTVIVSLLTFVLLVPIIRFLSKRLRDSGQGTSSNFRPRWILNFLILFVFFFLVHAAVIEMCYVATLKADKRMVSRAKSEYVEVIVTLGGATSNINDAKLELKDIEKNSSIRLEMLPLGDGEYACYVVSSDLPNKAYSLELTYPHLSLTLAYPFLGSQVRRSWPLIVTT